jgi:glyoxylase-like metal-dependent hydrolase (beta-lactamase superfamily II)
MSALRKISEHVYWMPPGLPDRPSLCAVVGDRWTVMLDAGSSATHAREFLATLAGETGTRPSAVVYTHSHWDHVLGGAELRGLVIAHAQTAALLLELAKRDWSDEGLDELVAAGLASPQHAADVKQELPSPRAVEVAPADVVFDQRIAIDVGSATVDVLHVGGDHSPDSCVMCVNPDGVLFLGDCLGASPAGVLTSKAAFRVRDVILGFPAEHYVEGHHEAVSSRAEMIDLFSKMKLAASAAFADRRIDPSDEDTEYFLQAFKAGRGYAGD